ARAHYARLSPPAALYLASATLEQVQRERAGADWMGAVQEAGEDRRYARSLFVRSNPAEPLHRSMERLKDHVAELLAHTIEPVILCDNAGQRDRLREMIGDAGATLGIGLVSAGFTLPDAGLAVMTDHEIFARYRRRRRRLKKTGGLSIAELSALRVGD